MATSDLATLPDVKDWISAGGTAMGSSDDPTLRRLITSISGMIYGYLSRQIIIPQTTTERYDGVSIPRLLLKNYPVLSVATIQVNGALQNLAAYPVIDLSNAWPPSGAILSPWDGLIPGKPQMIDAFGNSNSPAFNNGFSWGRQNVQVTYLAGYAVRNEAAVVPSGTPYTVNVNAPQGPWASDMGVTYADGTALVPVASSPMTGQYIAPVPSSQTEANPTAYTFAAGDAGAAVLITYGFVPAALNNACIEWVTERYRYRARVGQKSQTVSGQQTASYDTSGVPDFIKSSLNPYRDVRPVNLGFY